MIAKWPVTFAAQHQQCCLWCHKGTKEITHANSLVRQQAASIPFFSPFWALSRSCVHISLLSFCLACKIGYPSIVAEFHLLESLNSYLTVALLLLSVCRVLSSLSLSSGIVDCGDVWWDWHTAGSYPIAMMGYRRSCCCCLHRKCGFGCHRIWPWTHHREKGLNF